MAEDGSVAASAEHHGRFAYTSQMKWSSSSRNMKMIHFILRGFRTNAQVVKSFKRVTKLHSPDTLLGTGVMLVMGWTPFNFILKNWKQTKALH